LAPPRATTRATHGARISKAPAHPRGMWRCVKRRSASANMSAVSTASASANM